MAAGPIQEPIFSLDQHEKESPQFAEAQENIGSFTDFVMEYEMSTPSGAIAKSRQPTELSIYIPGPIERAEIRSKAENPKNWRLKPPLIFQKGSTFINNGHNAPPSPQKLIPVNQVLLC